MSLMSTAKSTATNALVSQAQQASAKLTSKLQSAVGKVTGGQNAQQLAEMAQRLQKGGLSALDKNQVQNLAEAKLASTMFRTGPRDELMTVDVFGISDSGILNSITGKLSGFGLSALDSFRKSTGLSTDLTSMLRSAGGVLSIDSSSLKDRVLSALGGTTGILRTLTGTLGNSITNGVNVDPKVMNLVEGVVNGVTTSFNSSNMTNARGLFDLVNQISGNSQMAQIFDVGAQANVLSGLFQEAIQLGVPDAISALMSNSEYSTAADYALRGNVELAVTMSDLDTTNLMIDTLGINRVLADVPDAALRLVENYRIPATVTNAGLDAELTKLVNTLNKIAPGWDTYNRDGTNVSDLSIYWAASDDALKLFNRDSTRRVAATIAVTYEPQAFRDAMRQMYPYAVI